MKSAPKPAPIAPSLSTWQLIPSIAENVNAALELRRNYGLNVIRQPYLEKKGFVWLSFQYTPHYDDPSAPTQHPRSLERVFSVEHTNFAIVTGRTSGNLFVHDCETDNAFHYVIDCLDERNIPVWAVKSTRGGHIYLRAKRNEVDNIKGGRIPNIEVWGNSRFVIAPPSVVYVRDSQKQIKVDAAGEPITHVYTWYRRDGDNVPVVNLRDIDFLTDKAGEPVPLKFRQKTPKRDKYQLEDYLANGHLITEGTRHNRLLAAATALRLRLDSDDEVRRELIRISVDKSIDPLPRAEAERVIRDGCAAAKRLNPRAKMPTWKKAFAWLQATPFTGHNGAIDRAVFEALIVCAKRDPSEYFRASCRELAELAHVHKDTALKAVNRLIGYGLIERSQVRDRVSKSSVYCFTSYLCQFRTFNVPIEILCSVSYIDTSRTDALERSALGKSGYRTYKAMVRLGRPATIKDIAAAAQLTPAAVKNVLRLNKPLPITGLVKHAGYQQRAGYLWIAISVTDERLEELIAQQHAPEKNPIGRSARRMKYHADERAQHATAGFLETIENPRPRMVETVQTVESSLVQTNEANDQRADLPTSNLVSADVAHKIDSSPIAPPTPEVSAPPPTPTLMYCQNCGQAHFLPDPPLKCAFCGDATTWKTTKPTKTHPPKSNVAHRPAPAPEITKEHAISLSMSLANHGHFTRAQHQQNAQKIDSWAHPVTGDRAELEHFILTHEPIKATILAAERVARR